MALTVAGAALYVPANVLPIMSVGRLGRPEPSTIVHGIGELFRLRLWPLAMIVLFASVLVPVLKLLSLRWFVLAIRRRWSWASASGRGSTASSTESGGGRTSTSS